jgi:flagellar operon protein
MVNRVDIGAGGPIQPSQPRRSGVSPADVKGKSFDAVIRQEIDGWKGIKFSAHALERLRVRNINLSAEDRDRIIDAIGRAEEKGAKDSLVLVRGAALVVSVTNKTIITALDRREMNGNVFTNIDSAVIMDMDGE